ncbi:rhomboid family intramembrane serine protease [Bacillus benzoevorans]|uniref:Membrane associated rhomboid family serine protease n=1 Tax=Bacillus benzoevorans TaxID=1456 RepID=A0A7X0HVL0_9BACI|nr:rhomboid family intramembrane serine protease [Bacillus benzoevorans]MBB6447669.1 membrane associated rhomboid family serine protease [Bacillus benzoevorans]
MFTRTESLKEFIRFYPVITAILLIHLVLYLLTVLPLFPNQWFFELFSGVNLFIMQGEIWRIITPIFMHNGFSHFLFNSFSLVIFGPALEKMIGPIRFTVVYLVTGISANVATLFLEPLTYMHVGSSGAIFGIFGYYISILIRQKHRMAKENKQLLITITVISVIMTFVQPQINVTAHLFGLISGFLIGLLSLQKK